MECCSSTADRQGFVVDPSLCRFEGHPSSVARLGDRSEHWPQSAPGSVLFYGIGCFVGASPESILWDHYDSRVTAIPANGSGRTALEAISAILEEPCVGSAC